MSLQMQAQKGSMGNRRLQRFTEEPLSSVCGPVQKVEVGKNEALEHLALYFFNTVALTMDDLKKKILPYTVLFLKIRQTLGQNGK